MKTRRILIYGSLAASLAMLQFGPYRNNELLKKMEGLDNKIRLIQKAKDRLEVLNIMYSDRDISYREDDRLIDSVVEYLAEEKGYLAA